jgi:hypothetical protein
MKQINKIQTKVFELKSQIYEIKNDLFYFLNYPKVIIFYVILALLFAILFLYLNLKFNLFFVVIFYTSLFFSTGGIFQTMLIVKNMEKVAMLNQILLKYQQKKYTEEIRNRYK